MSDVPPQAALAKAAQALTICNACRYCEGFCAVFPAMERRLSFEQGDLDYLANLCHQCGECLDACQYAPPHPFDVAIPRALARVRLDSYARYAWPRALAGAFQRNGTLTAVVLVLLLLAGMTLALRLRGSTLLAPVAGANFYALVPHSVMAWAFGIVALYVVLALAIGVARFWRDIGETGATARQPFAWREALRDVLTLRYLDGAGTGCRYPDDVRPQRRRLFHQLTMYGFLLCFAATCTATVHHYLLGQPAPYALGSLPVLLGTAGGIGLVIGPAGLLWLRRGAARGDEADGFAAVDRAFVLLLVLTSASGLLLLAARETAAMGVLLVVHLAIVMALFVTMPDGKFVHMVYRSAALLKYAVERRRPGLSVGSDS